MVHGEPGWELALQDLKTGWVLVPADSTLESLLAELVEENSAGGDARRSTEFKVVYRDETAVLFRRGGGD
jgi:hypothetical protein